MRLYSSGVRSGDFCGLRRGNLAVMRLFYGMNLSPTQRKTLITLAISLMAGVVASVAPEYLDMLRTAVCSP